MLHILLIFRLFIEYSLTLILIGKRRRPLVPRPACPLGTLQEESRSHVKADTERHTCVDD